MRRGVVYSAVLHGAIAVIALGALPHLLPEPEEMPPVLPIELLTVDELTNVKQQEKAKEPEKTEEKPAEKEPVPMREAALPEEAQPATEPAPAVPPPPEPEAVPEAMPLPKQEEKPKEETKPETAAATPQVKPKPPTPQKKTGFDATRIAALLNKIPPQEESENLDEKEVKPQSTEATEAAGLQTDLTVSELDALRAQMARCWTMPAGASNPETLIVDVHIWLNPDGTLGRPPELSAGSQARLALGDPYFRVAVEAALRAVNMCQPYKLPVEKYSSWRDITMTFNPRYMLGG
jgi:outer membrane biosynthesis protein TonB